MGQTIRIPSKDGDFNAYLAVPASGRGPGIVMCQEIFGVNVTMRTLADQYAAAGYVVVVPDLFWRMEPGVELDYSPEGWQRAFGFFQKYDQDKGVEDIDAAIAALRQRPELDASENVGVIGYCLGGKMAYLAACRCDVACSVGYYGVGIEQALDEADNIQGRLVLQIAGEDEYCPPEARSQIAAKLATLPRAEAFTYPGVDHAFARPNGEHYDQAADELARSRTLAALRDTIGPR
jgi:carboxymethylenebutenolidase